MAAWLWYKVVVWRALTIGCLSVLLWTPSAVANGFDIFGAGARSQGMAGAAAATVSDYTAVYHNPASLVFGQPSFGLGLFGTSDHTTILLMPRPTGYDPADYSNRINDRADTGEPGTAGSLLLASAAGVAVGPCGGRLDAAFRVQRSFPRSSASFSFSSSVSFSASPCCRT